MRRVMASPLGGERHPYHASVVSEVENLSAASREVGLVLRAWGGRRQCRPLLRRDTLARKAFSTTNRDGKLLPKRALIDKTTGPAAAEEFGGGKIRWGEGKARKVRTHCYHSRRSSSHLRKSATTATRPSP